MSDVRIFGAGGLAGRADAAGRIPYADFGASGRHRTRLGVEEG
ncbi:hypothetical protein [Streptosporangium sp. NPDC002524]